jgi:hypothetical protein
MYASGHRRAAYRAARRSKMITLYTNGWAFRFRHPLIDAAMRENWRDGWQTAFRYYYVEV